MFGKQSKGCFTCQKLSYNLMSANCGHKICFNCVKNNKNNHKCLFCLKNQSKSIKNYPSPFRKFSNNQQQQRDRSSKYKDSDSRLNSDNSPHIYKSMHKSSVNAITDDQESDPNILKCKEHHEPLSMYCKQIKELICSVCLCTRSKHNNDILPIKNAEQLIKKQNKACKQQAKLILNNIENAHKTMNKNVQHFKNCYQNSLNLVNSTFEQVHKQLQKQQELVKREFLQFFESKFKECEQISGDLNYLMTIIKEYRDENKQNNNLNESIYLLASFKVIKNTVKNLDLDYLNYSKDISIVEINKFQIQDSIDRLVRLKLQLPLRYQDRRIKSYSNKSASRSKHEQLLQNDQISRSRALNNISKTPVKESQRSISKKHQMSHCGTIYGKQQSIQERNLYKMLLKTKFKL